MSLAFSLLTGALSGIVLSQVASQLVLLAATLRRRERPGGLSHAALRMTVVIPAHNEEMVLGETLASLQAQEYPADAFDVVVIADNCTDRTAAIARAAGAQVLERSNLEERGKGFALDWAFQRLLRSSPAEVFVVVDADTWVAPDFLARMAGHLQGETGEPRRAVQGRYGVLNRSEGWRAALMAAAFDLVNHVKPLGRERLGLSVGLKGNGMAFTRPLLQCARWQGRSVTEDLDFGLDLLVQHGIRVEYAPEARVLAQMPISARQASSQRERWEGGRYQLMGQRLPSLLSAAARKRDLRLLDAALDLTSLPLAELTAALILLTGLVLTGISFKLLPGAGLWLTVPMAAFLGLALYVFGGLRISGAPTSAYAALLRAPFYTLWKLALYMIRLPRLRAAAAGTEWVRTARAPMGAPDPDQKGRG